MADRALIQKRRGPQHPFVSRTGFYVGPGLIVKNGWAVDANANLPLIDRKISLILGEHLERQDKKNKRAFRED